MKSRSLLKTTSKLVRYGLLGLLASLALSSCGEPVDPRELPKEEIPVETPAPVDTSEPAIPKGDKDPARRPTRDNIYKAYMLAAAPPSTKPAEGRCVADEIYRSPLTNDFVESLANNANAGSNGKDDSTYFASDFFLNGVSKCYGFKTWEEMSTAERFQVE